ncbi:MAG TPA: hypothetical protein VJ596_11135 [Gemmatimonadaceae bacterium]|nr:hypothetical protein [Gemmatimonadaceae bacterium]
MTLPQSSAPFGRRRTSALLCLALITAACSDDDGPTAPEVCGSGGGLIANLNELQGVVVTSEQLESCNLLPGNGANYLVVPQFASSGSAASLQYTIGAEDGMTASVAARLAANEETISRQAAFDRALREAERSLRPDPALTRRSGPSLSTIAAVPELNSTRDFNVLASLAPGEPQFETATARLRFVGDNILLYVDIESPAGGFSDQELTALGTHFDNDLFEIGVANFGNVSDIDADDRVLVLLTPLVNRLTPASSCASEGFITGFFFGLDLIAGEEGSNEGEVFYALVPDPSAQFSCAHSAAQVRSIVPATFIHELQHMISFNEHVLVRNGTPEELWLNEGLSHMAEEIVALDYERRFPPPAGRTNPQQLFPDSAGPFITGNLLNSYTYLANSHTVSATSLAGTGSLSERGATWLFLRWLGDHEGNGIFKRLVQTGQTGITNIQAQAGEPFPGLFGDFGVAVYTDSIIGVPRSQVPERLRFTSRNLRVIYQALFNALTVNGQPNARVPRPFPIELRALPPNGQATDAMVPGTMDHFQIQSTSAPEVELIFRRSTGEPFAPTLNAQVGVFRLPD